MSKYIFQEGGEDLTGASYFNDYVDQFLQNQQEYESMPQYVQDRNSIEEVSEEDEYIKNIHAYDDERIEEQREEEYSQRDLLFKQMQEDLDYKISTLQQQIDHYAYYNTPEGQDEVETYYNTQKSQPVQFSLKPNIQNNPYSYRPQSTNNTSNFNERIAKVETANNNYKEYNSYGAAGKYQVKYKEDKDWIDKVAGHKTTLNEFLNSPDLQEKYFEWRKNNYLQPEVEKTRKFADKYNFSDEELMALIHFKGAAGLRKRLKEGNLDAVYKNGKKVDLSLMEYLKKAGFRK